MLKNLRYSQIGNQSIFLKKMGGVPKRYSNKQYVKQTAMYLDNRILKVPMLAKLLVETLFFSSEKVLKLQFLHLWSKPGDVFLQWSYNPYKEGHIFIYITLYN